MPELGDLRTVEYEPDVFEIEVYANHSIEGIWTSEPFWALPNWADIGILEFVGPFSTPKEANIQIRIVKNRKDPNLEQIQ
jgi:hypothetical protein